jgi:Tol biopolymer transport system component
MSLVQSGRRDLVVCFTIDQDQGWTHVFLMAPNGGHRVNLTPTDSLALDPALSPDGSRLAFIFGNASAPQDQYCLDLVVMNLDGSERRQLTHLEPGAHALAPAWSPDGQQLAFGKTARKGTGASLDIYMINVEGTELRRLGKGAFPSWSPDGNHILCTRWSGRSEQTRLFAVDVRTGAARRISDCEAMAGVWSPDGRQIAFIAVTDPDDMEMQLSVMNSDGTGVYLLDRCTMLLAPLWARGGKEIFYTRVENCVFVPGSGEIHAIEPEGGTPRRLSDREAQDYTGGGHFFAGWN